MIRSDYKDYDIVIQIQQHPSYQPWIGLITHNTKNKVYMWNIEGQTVQETLEKCKNFIDNCCFLE